MPRRGLFKCLQKSHPLNQASPGFWTKLLGPRFWWNNPGARFCYQNLIPESGTRISYQIWLLQSGSGTRIWYRVSVLVLVLDFDTQSWYQIVYFLVHLARSSHAGRAASLKMTWEDDVFIPCIGPEEAKTAEIWNFVFLQKKIVRRPLLKHLVVHCSNINCWHVKWLPKHIWWH